MHAGVPVADLGEGPGGPPPLFVDQSKARPEGRNTCIARAHTDQEQDLRRDF